jgi:hypothetical protein
MKRRPPSAPAASRARARARVPDRSIGIYLDTAFERTISGLNDAAIELAMYKGYVVLSVKEDSERARAIAKHIRVEVGGQAWLAGRDFDRVIAALREARAMWRQHQVDVRRIAACAACRKLFAAVCDKHRPLFDKYRRPTRRRGRR